MLVADSLTVRIPAHVRDQLHVTAGVVCWGGCGRAVVSSRWQLLYHLSLYLLNNWKMKHIPSRSISFLKRSYWNLKLLGNANHSLVTSSNCLKQWILNKLDRRSFWIGLIVRFYLTALTSAHSLTPPQVYPPAAAWPLHQRVSDHHNLHVSPCGGAWAECQLCHGWHLLVHWRTENGRARFTLWPVAGEMVCLPLWPSGAGSASGPQGQLDFSGTV